jgi:predicted permease
VNPDASVYGAALALALVSGILFGLIPVRQVLRVDSYQIIKAGPGGTLGPSGNIRRMTARDLLLAVQIAICAVLVTSSIVAVRGLARTLRSNFGFEPRNAMLIDPNLNLAGYKGDTVPPMQRRMITALEKIPGVESVGVINNPPLYYGGGPQALVFSDQTTDLRPADAAASAFMYSVSPDYLEAAGTALLAGRALSWHDDENSPRVAVVNKQFAAKVLGSATNPVGSYYKMRDGTRIQVVGTVEDGKYFVLTEDPRPAMFLPILQSPTILNTWLVVRSNRDPQQLAPALRGALRDLDRGLSVYTQTWDRELAFVLFPSRMATIALGLLGVMGAMLSITGLFGMAAYSVSKRMKELGIRVALGAQRKEVLQAALGRAVKLLAIGSIAGLLLGILAARVLASIVYQATPRDPLVLAGVVMAMLLLGLLATWIPARRALSIDPLVLLREE